MRGGWMGREVRRVKWGVEGGQGVGGGGVTRHCL